MKVQLRSVMQEGLFKFIYIYIYIIYIYIQYIYTYLYYSILLHWLQLKPRTSSMRQACVKHLCPVFSWITCDRAWPDFQRITELLQVDVVLQTVNVYQFISLCWSLAYHASIPDPYHQSTFSVAWLHEWYMCFLRFLNLATRFSQVPSLIPRENL